MPGESYRPITGAVDKNVFPLCLMTTGEEDFYTGLLPRFRPTHQDFKLLPEPVSGNGMEVAEQQLRKSVEEMVVDVQSSLSSLSLMESDKTLDVDELIVVKDSSGKHNLHLSST